MSRKPTIPLVPQARPKAALHVQAALSATAQPKRLSPVVAIPGVRPSPPIHSAAQTKPLLARPLAPHVQQAVAAVQAKFAPQRNPVLCHRHVPIASTIQRANEKFLNYQPEDFEDFEQHYVDADYDEEDRQVAEQNAMKVFGVSWDQVDENTLIKKEKELLGRAKAAEEGDVGKINAELRVLNISIFFKVGDRARQKKHYTQTDRINQALAQE